MFKFAAKISKKPMKYLLSILIVLTVNPIFSQVQFIADGYTFEQGKEPKSKTNEGFIGKSGDFVFTAGERKGTVFLGKHEASSFEKVWQIEIEAELKQNKTEFNYYKTIFLGEDLHIVYSGFNKKEKRFIVVDKIYDQEGVIKKSIVLSRTPAMNEEDVKWDIIPTPNEENIAIRVFTGLFGNAKLKANITWFDNNFTKIDEFSIKTKSLGLYATIKSETVTNQKNYVFAFHDKSTPSQEIHLYNHFYGKGYVENTISIASDDILSADLSYNPVNDEIGISGFYGTYKKKKNIIKGYFHNVYKRSDFSLVKENVSTIDDVMKADLIGERRFNEKRVRGESISFRFDNTYYVEDGSYYVVYEDFLVVTSSDGMGGYTTTYTASDILIIFYDNQNIQKYYTVVPRTNATTFSTNLETIALSGIIIGNNLKLYFTLTSKVAAELYPDEKGFENLNNRVMSLLSVTVTPDSKIEVDILLQYRMLTKFFYLSCGEIEVNKTNDELFFTVYADGYGQKRNLVSIVKDKD